MSLLRLLQDVGAVPFVSVYENGSKDGTPEFLSRWNLELDAWGIPHKINIDAAPSWKTLYARHKETNASADLEDKTAFRIRSDIGLYLYLFYHM